MGHPLGKCYVFENCHGSIYYIGNHDNFSKARPSEPRFFIYTECAALNSRAHKGGIKMNALYRNAILVTLEPDDPFIRLTTLDRQHGKSSSFLLDADKITQLLTFKTDSLLDNDLLSFARMYLLNPDLAILRVTWIRDSSADNTVTGYRQTLVLPTAKLLAVLDGKTVRVLSDELPLAPVSLTDTAQRMIRGLHSAHQKRALCKALRDNFHWRTDEHITLFADWGNDFGFSTDTLYGGLCLHSSQVTGSNGRVYEKLFYSVHT